MKKKTFLLVIVLFLLLLAIILLLMYRNFYPASWRIEIPIQQEKQNRACFKNFCFNVELARTAEERSVGLMFREKLDSQEGMLFIFEKEGRHPFWMKNVLIPLDIIWINKNKEIVFLSENVQPCKEDSCPFIEPLRNAKYVLEIKGGLAKKIGLSLEQKLDLKY